ncbi:MAG: hypothetical protein ACEPO8_12295 [Rhodothermaceae bacterium]
MNRYLYLLILIAFTLVSCSDDGTKGTDAATDSDKDKDIRKYNLEIQKEQAAKRTPCDALSVEEFVIKNYEKGSYLVEFDKTYTYSLHKPAVLHHNTRNSKLVFAVIAKSKPGERLVEKKNIVGYESSFINLDSTKLGTAFFFLTMFECYNDELVPVWEAEVPRHGGFNYMKMNQWSFNRTPYITLNFEDGIISGHRDYNYFFIDGFFERPHLLETYEGLVHKRTMQNFNNDKFPDYYEYRFIDSLLQVSDSIPFRWDEKRKVYHSPVNKRWIRKY